MNILGDSKLANTTQRDRVMHMLWLSVKENMNCVSKLTDVVSSRPKSSDGKRMSSSGSESIDTLNVAQMGFAFQRALFRPNNPRVQFCELGIEDASRNIVEMIFQKASMDPTKPIQKVERVLRVKNPSEVLERFERHREAVMKKAHQQLEKNPRSLVDGNEMLLFYNTTVTCCNKKSKKVSEVCKIPTCRLCRMIQSKFDTESTRRSGVRLSISSDEMIDNTFGLTGVKDMRRAVVLCRIIAGRVANTVDGFYKEWDSVGREGLSSELEYLTVKNPCAILPCFIIVFS